MNRLLDPLLEAAEGGTSPRRRGLAESMIAGRRRPGDEGVDDDDRSKRPAGGGSSRGRGSSPKSTASSKSDESAAKSPPARRRRRPASSSAARKTEAETPPRDEDTPPAADDERELFVPDGTDESEGETPVERAMREEPTPPAPPVATPSTDEAPRDLVGLVGEVGQLRSLVEQQRQTLAELRAGMLTLGRQMDRSGYRPRLGVFVDVPNLIYGFESAQQLHMGKLLDMLREGRQLVRATAYSPVSDDPREPLEQQRFVAPFVPYDYRIVTKPLKRFADGSIKGNFDVELAIDMLSMADRVDVVAVVSGDADFARAVEAVQSRGVRVEVVAFSGSTSLEMRALADHYLELTTVVDQIT